MPQLWPIAVLAPVEHPDVADFGQSLPQLIVVEHDELGHGEPLTQGANNRLDRLGFGARVRGEEHDQLLLAGDGAQLGMPVGHGWMLVEHGRERWPRRADAEPWGRAPACRAG